ncbi:DUF368 domain-containing protein [Pontibacter sp. G13]|uniref:DUF368 domain-containing protein n=1 Tax=Pontibacter sp. G13 TaxID=3074898 RepID=UPI00288B0BCC|nr:DUF368 domain-containing protein [Pontibacter sp. G13]WNJ16007.1 DUF368 domain-containing protein [Pontibacter sp. G13]
MKSLLLLFLKGLAMGAANVIPGVSGGTIALITGIYERLIHAVKSFDLDAVKLIFQGKFKDFWEHIDGSFLVAVFLGIGVSLISIAKAFKFLLENETYAVWLMAFFLGLIAISIVSVGKTVEKWDAKSIVALVIGLIAALSIAFLTPASENDSLPFLLLCGVIAMCSMILPGLSGSFVLIILGNYKLIMLDAVSELNFTILGPVAVGAILGLLAFSRVLSWIFEHHRDVTISLMTGFIMGSLTIIWPWKNELHLMENGVEVMKKGKPVISGYEWYIPDFAATETWVAIGLIVLGIASVWGMEKMAERFSNSNAAEVEVQ